ncbi:MAG: signal recognition particle-docking protein FtsY [Eubacteriales bacterium]|nr:signal recognition particle-docking protein FtsY [Eubacteriales bacterium]MDY4213233.1 signal recognition particle-docking protein FtsY [Eubacteriales bacterium]
MAFFSKLRESLSKTKNSINDKIENVMKTFSSVDDDLFDELEEALITADLGVNTSMDIIEKLRDAAAEKHIKNSVDLKAELAAILEGILTEGSSSKLDIRGLPAVVMVIGVNGVGKTTSIGKLAAMYKKQGKNVVIAAADTFRAAAIEQLEIWAERADVRIIKQQEGSDPAAVIYDAINACKGKYVDVLLCDTAGRLHNKKNLMQELKKIYKILDRELPMSGKEVLLVLDATTGQNAVMQAKEFKEAADITGIILTKLDGTAKGGITFAIKNEYDIPVKLVGVGEGIDDIEPFDAKEFVGGIIDTPAE